MCFLLDLLDIICGRRIVISCGIGRVSVGVSKFSKVEFEERKYAQKCIRVLFKVVGRFSVLLMCLHNGCLQFHARCKTCTCIFAL